MESYKSCSFFGHRKIEDSEGLSKKIETVVEDLIVKENVTIFLFGSKSEFDSLCYKVVTYLKEKYSFIKRIAYTCRSESCTVINEGYEVKKIYSKFYNKEIPLLIVEEEYNHQNKYKSGKASYVERNQAMIDNSNFCIFYYNKNYIPPIKNSSKQLFIRQPTLGTELEYNYAKRKNKKILNLFDKP